MKITLTKLSKPALSGIADLVEMYQKRLRPLTKFETVVQKADASTLRSQPGHCLVLLDERGKQFTSHQLALKFTELSENPAIKSVQIVVGGPYGFEDIDRAKADWLWSLSPLTLQGDIAWLIAAEQIYRTFTILNKIPYHH